jgi:hypothetical protein
MKNDNGARAEILAIRESNPNASASDIAREIGISRQYVYTILRTLGLQINVGGYRPRGRKFAQPRVVTGGVTAAITHTTAGTIGELLVAADLMARGFVVFHPLVRSKALCDLITQDQRGLTERIEVKCGKKISNGKLQFNKPSNSHHDRLAIVITGETVKYIPPFSGDK